MEGKFLKKLEMSDVKEGLIVYNLASQNYGRIVNVKKSAKLIKAIRKSLGLAVELKAGEYKPYQFDVLWIKEQYLSKGWTKSDIKDRLLIADETAQVLYGH